MATEQNPWADIPAHYHGRWGYDYDDRNKVFFVHCGGHRILDAEDSEVANAVCLAYNGFKARERDFPKEMAAIWK